MMPTDSVHSCDSPRQPDVRTRSSYVALTKTKATTNNPKGHHGMSAANNKLC